MVSYIVQLLDFYEMINYFGFLKSPTKMFKPQYIGSNRPVLRQYAVVVIGFYEFYVIISYWLMKTNS
jgi:hypothetical protein